MTGRFRIHLLTAVLALSQFSSFSLGDTYGDAKNELRSNPTDAALLKNLVRVAQSHGDQTQNAEALCLYYLRARQAGRSEEALKLWRLMNANDDRERQHFRKMVQACVSECQFCSGTGHTKSKCRRCKGAGRCTVCKGRGERAIPRVSGRDRVVRCTTCNATGGCKSCAGNGSMKTGCTTCGTRGKVPDAGKLASLYDSLIGSGDGRHLTSGALTDAVSVDTALARICTELVSALHTNGYTSAVVYKVYLNGSARSDLSKTIQRKLLISLLSADTSIIFMDRADLALVEEENSLRFVTGAEDDRTVDTSHSLIMGELIWQQDAGELMLSVRAVETMTSRVIAAPFEFVRLDDDLAKRLGTGVVGKAQRAMSRPSTELSNQVASVVKRVASDGGTISMAESSSLPADYIPAYRILYSQLTATFVESGLAVLERELLHHVMEEQNIAHALAENLLTGDTVLKIEADRSSQPSSPTFFVKAVARANGALRGMAEIEMVGPAKGGRVSRTGGGAVSIATDDSMEAAIDQYNLNAQIQDVGSLKIKASIILSDRMVPSDEAMENMDHAQSYFLHRVARDSADLVKTWSPNSNEKNAVNGVAAFTAALESLIPISNGDPVVLKAHLTSMMVNGFKISTGGDAFLSTTVVYPGPITELCGMLTSKFTPKKTREPDPYFWSKCLYEGFSKRLYASMDSTQRSELKRSHTRPLDPNEGMCSIKTRDYDFKFNYRIVVKWDGKLPSEAVVTIDLREMKDKLYLVKE
ncbi:MAG: hypothetical protein ACI96M_000391 [Candidatus Azotimanducaceae bacterium]|jgi:hypothetical protein